MDFNTWCDDRKKNYPQFHYWTTTMELEVYILTFVRFLREANLAMYLDALTELDPWFYALDHTNYARWIPVHLRDMAELPKTHPDIHREFTNGHFTAQRPNAFFLLSPLIRHTSKITLVLRVMEVQLASLTIQVPCTGE